MRILVVQESDWLEKGPHQSHHLMERMVERGHQVLVIDYEILWRTKRRDSLIGRRSVFREVRKATSKGGVTVVRPAFIRLPALNYLALIVTHWREIRNQMAQFKPDIIVGFGLLNSWIALRYARRHRIPFVYYMIDELHRLVPEPRYREIARMIETSNMKRADMVISINEALREYTIRMGATRERTEVIRAGIDLERFNPEIHSRDIRRKHGVEQDDILLFFMGWLYEFSGLVEVATEMSKDTTRYERIKLMVMGRGDLWASLERISRMPGMEGRIAMIDWRPYDEVPIYIGAADACILPALDDKIMMNIVPIKIYEYMAVAKPVISTRLPGILAEFGEDNGVVYVRSPEEVLRKAIDLADGGHLKTQGRKARDFVKGSDWSRIADTFERRMIDLTNSASTGCRDRE